MKAKDFRFDDRQLSDFGFVICSFSGGKSLDTVTMGSKIKFNLVSTKQGKEHLLASSEYEECLESEIDICLSLCDNNSLVVPMDLQREIMRWLNRKTFHKFEYIDEDGDYTNIYFNGSFNVEKVMLGQDVVGFHLTLTTDKPFGYQEEERKVFNVSDTDIVYRLTDMSDEIGYIYPKMVITCLDDGDLTITNKFDNRITQIKNVSENEVITMTYPMVTSSDNTHTTLLNDFNWNFPRVNNSYNKKINDYEFSLPCKVEIKYTPIAKVSL